MFGFSQRSTAGHAQLSLASYCELMHIARVHRNERKLQVLEAFATHGQMRPIHLASEVGIYPVRRAYTYLLRLHRWGYLHRGRDYMGQLLYRLSPKGARYLLWRRRGTSVVSAKSASQTRANEGARKKSEPAQTSAEPLVRAEPQNMIIGVAGREGSGKSSQARKILEQCPRLFLFDSVGEHAWVPERYEQLDKAIMCLLETPYRDEFSASLTPMGDDLEVEFSECCDEVYNAGKMMFAIEEIPMLATASYTPDSLNRIVRLGRHKNISLLYTAQRLSETPRALTSATDLFVLFSHSEPRDLKAIAVRCGSEVAEKVRGLGNHGFLVWDVLRRRVVPVSEDWYRRLAFNCPPYQWTRMKGNGRRGGCSGGKPLSLASPFA